MRLKGRKVIQAKYETLVREAAASQRVVGMHINTQRLGALYIHISFGPLHVHATHCARALPTLM